MSFQLRNAVVRGVCLLAGGALLLAGCTSTDEESQGASGATKSVQVARVDDIAATVPDKIKNAGKLVVGVNLPYQPNEYRDADGTIVGFDVDLLDAVASVLGLTTDYQASDFDKIIPAIQAGTYDVGMSSFTDTREREQVVDFTTYFSAGVQWAQPVDRPIDPSDACGKKVAVQSTTVQDTEEVPAKSAKCTADGKPPIEIVKFDRQDDATNALVLGKVDAMSADSPVTAYAIKQSEGKIEASGPVFDSAPYGWPVAKGSPLAMSLLRALEHLIADGTYATITDNWGVAAGRIEKPVINGAVN